MTLCRHAQTPSGRTSRRRRTRRRLKERKRIFASPWKYAVVLPNFIIDPLLDSTTGGFLMDDELVNYALARILDDIRIGEWATGEVDKRLKRKGPQDHEFWVMYTTVTNELLDAVRKKNEPSR